MTKLLRQAIEAVHELPVDQQDDAARLLFAFLGHDEASDAISSKHLAGVLEGLDQVKDGKFATEDEVGAAFKSFGP